MDRGIMSWFGHWEGWFAVSVLGYAYSDDHGRTIDLQKI